MDHTGYTTVEDYVRAQHEVFFGESVDADINSADWRVALARRLRERLTFVNLLRVLEGRPKPLSKILERLRPSLPVASDREAAGVLNGLCALISAARRQDDDARVILTAPQTFRTFTAVLSRIAAFSFRRESRPGPLPSTARTANPTRRRTGRRPSPAISTAW